MMLDQFSGFCLEAEIAVVARPYPRPFERAARRAVATAEPRIDRWIPPAGAERRLSVVSCEVCLGIGPAQITQIGKRHLGRPASRRKTEPGAADGRPGAA